MDRFNGWHKIFLIIVFSMVFYLSPIPALAASSGQFESNPPKAPQSEPQALPDDHMSESKEISIRSSIKTSTSAMLKKNTEEVRHLSDLGKSISESLSIGPLVGRQLNSPIVINTYVGVVLRYKF